MNSQVVTDHDQKYLLSVLRSPEPVSNLLKCLNAQIEDVADLYCAFSFPEEDLTLQIRLCSPQIPIIDYSKREYSSLELVAHGKIEY